MNAQCIIYYSKIRNELDRKNNKEKINYKQIRYITIKYTFANNFCLKIESIWEI